MADPWSHASTSSDPQSLSSPASDFAPYEIGHNLAVYRKKVTCRVCKRNAGKFSFNPTHQVSKRFQVLVVYNHLNVDDEVVWNCRSVVFWDEWQDEIIAEMNRQWLKAMPTIADDPPPEHLPLQSHRPPPPPPPEFADEDQAE